MAEVYEFSIQNVQGFNSVKDLVFYLDIEEEGVECFIPLAEDYADKVLEIPPTSTITISIRSASTKSILAGGRLTLGALDCSTPLWVPLYADLETSINPSAQDSPFRVQLCFAPKGLDSSKLAGTFAQSLVDKNRDLRRKLHELQQSVNHYKWGLQQHVTYTKHVTQEERAAVSLLTEKLRLEANNYALVKQGTALHILSATGTGGKRTTLHSDHHCAEGLPAR